MGFRSLLWIAIALAVPLSGIQAQAQESGRWRIVPRLGSFVGNDTDAFEIQGADRGRIKLGNLIGIGIDLDSPLPWLGFRLAADRSIGSEASFFETRCDLSACPLGPPVLVVKEAAMSTFSMDLRLQPGPRTWRVRPFIVGGFDRFRVSIDGDTPERPVRYGHHYGYGMDVDLGPLPLRLEGVHGLFQDNQSRIMQMHYSIVGSVRLDLPNLISGQQM